MPDAERNDGDMNLIRINKVPQSFLFPTHKVRSDEIYDHEFFYMCLTADKDAEIVMKNV